MQYKNIKKGFDYLFLIIISPILIILIAFFSLLIKIFNPKESVFFIQDRVGYNGKIFKMIKFRTMYSSSKNNLFTSEDDARIDNLGVFLRRFRIDELPQFINILAGQMSLIGPRPEQVHFVKVLTEKYGERFNIRHEVFPGITGLAQVEHGYVSDFDDYLHKLNLDIQYVNSFSLLQDIKIFFKTFYIVFFKVGSR